MLLGLLCAVSVLAQPRPADQDELDAIRSHFELNLIPDWKTHYQLLDFEGVYTAREDPNESDLYATVWFKPYLVQERLCSLQAWHARGIKQDDVWRWSEERSSYFYWKADQRRCSLEHSSNRPANAVFTSDEIPTAQVIQAIYEADSLLRMGLDYALNEADYDALYKEGSVGPERMRARFRRLSEDDGLRLTELRLSPESTVEVGFALVATYGSDRAQEGPVIKFSVTPNGFVIHGVGHWMA